MRRVLLALLLASSHCAPQVVDAVGEVGASGAGSGASAGTGAGGQGAVGGSSGDGGVPQPSPDRDGDGVPDVEDGCPDQPAKLEPGVCGCDLPDEDHSDYAGCFGLMRGLAHRYSFDGTGDVASDTAGLVPDAAVAPALSPADGVVVNTTLTGSASVSLAGGMNGDDTDDQYVRLPSGLLAGLESVTVEAWVTWYGGRTWQRIFDFGSNDSGVPDAQGSAGMSYLFLATSFHVDEDVNLPRVAFRPPDFLPEVVVNATRPFPIGIETHVAVVLDAPSDTLSLYLDGTLEGSAQGAAVPPGIPLRANLVVDENNWLGRSQYVADAELSASIEELRIYAVPLTAAQLRTSMAAGPNPRFFPSP